MSAGVVTRGLHFTKMGLFAVANAAQNLNIARWDLTHNMNQMPHGAIPGVFV